MLRQLAETETSPMNSVASEETAVFEEASKPVDLAVSQLSDQLVDKLHSKVDELLEDPHDAKVYSNSSAARSRKRESTRKTRMPSSLLSTIADISELRTLVESFRTEPLPELCGEDVPSTTETSVNQTADPSTSQDGGPFPSPDARHHIESLSPQHSQMGYLARCHWSPCRPVHKDTTDTRNGLPQVHSPISS